MAKETAKITKLQDYHYKNYHYAILYIRKKTKIDNEQSKRLNRRSTRYKQKSVQIYTKEIISGIWEGGE